MRKHGAFVDTQQGERKHKQIKHYARTHIGSAHIERRFNKRVVIEFFAALKKAHIFQPYHTTAVIKFQLPQDLADWVTSASGLENPGMCRNCETVVGHVAVNDLLLLEGAYGEGPLVGKLQVILVGRTLHAAQIFKLLVAPWHEVGGLWVPLGIPFIAAVERVLRNLSYLQLVGGAQVNLPHIYK